MKKCLKCGYVRLPEDRAPDFACPNCQAIYAKVEAQLAEDQKQHQGLTAAQTTGDWRNVDPELIKREASKIILTTTEIIPDQHIRKIMGVVSADYAYAFGGIAESVAGLARNLVGSGQSGRTVEFLKEGRAAVLQALRFNALQVAANAVIAVRFDYEEISGANGHGILIVTATGTAVCTIPPAGKAD